MGKYCNRINKKVYKVNIEEVDKFLEAEPHIAKKICELFDVAENFLFNIEEYSLRVEIDREYHGWEVTICLNIFFKMSTDEIMEAWDKIDDAWYLEQDHDLLQNFNYQIYRVEEKER